MHAAQFGWIGRRQKTAKVCCGRTVKVECIAVDSDATCAECVARIDEDTASYAEMIAYGKGRGRDTGELERAAAKREPIKYRTVYFL